MASTKNLIIQNLEVLKAQPLTGCRRVTDDTVQIFEIGTHALHVSSAWRIVGKAGIIVGADDFEDEEEDGAKNKLDRLVARLMKSARNQPMLVAHIDADDIGGLTLQFSNDMVLEIMGFESADVEWWRMMSLEDETENHFVVTGTACYSSAPPTE